MDMILTSLAALITILAGTRSQEMDGIVKVSLEGFKAMSRTLDVEVNRTFKVDATLEVAASTRWWS